MTTLLAHGSQHERVAPSSHPGRQGHRLPPPGYAIARLADGRFAPLGTVPFQPDEPLAGLFPLRWSAELIQEAQARHASDGDLIAFPTYQEALGWCQRRAETTRLLSQAAVAALRAECYPERNVWYREEIERLLHEAGYGWPALPESDDEEKRDAEKYGPFCIVEALDGHPRLLAWLEVTKQGERWEPESRAASETAAAKTSPSLPWASERPFCPFSHLHVEAANPDELWERLYEAVSTLLAWHRKEVDDEPLPLAQTAS